MFKNIFSPNNYEQDISLRLYAINELIVLRYRSTNKYNSKRVIKISKRGWTTTITVNDNSYVIAKNKKINKPKLGVSALMVKKIKQIKFSYWKYESKVN